MMKKVRAIVLGRVQGVWFRANTMQEARLLGVRGYARNLSDGSVEIVAEGEEDDVKDFLSWAHAGPSTARVDDVEVRWRSYTGEYTDFRITR